MGKRISYLCDCCKKLNSDIIKLELEAKTGKMVSFRDRAKYNASQARLQRNKRSAAKPK